MPLYTEFDKRNRFYINKYRKLIKWFLILSLVNLTLLLVMYYLFRVRPEPIYYASTSDGRIFEVKNFPMPEYESS